MKNLILLLLIPLLIACGNIETSSNQSIDSLLSNQTEFDLSSYGVPVSITLPEGTVIKKGALSVNQGGVNLINLDIENGQFDMSVFYYDVDQTGASLSRELAADKAEIFNFIPHANLISEDENGYFYSFKDRGGTDYGFTHIVPVNNTFCYFEAGVSNVNFTKEAAEMIYAAAKSAR